MSKIFVFAATVTLLGVTACNSTHPNVSTPAAASAAAVEAAPKAAEPVETVVAKAAEPVAVAKPAEATPKANVQAAREVKPVAKPQAPAAKPEVRAAADAGVITKEQALALAGKSGCLVCHKIETKVVGPAWKDIGAKFKADANAASTIAAHIKSGGSFGWKMGNMPPRGGSSIKDADVDSLAKFIASLK